MVWINRIDFAGFGNLSGEKIEFEERKLNLVLESDSIGKITVFSALWATLFNLPQIKAVIQNEVSDRARFAPFEGSGLPYISGLDLYIDSRYLKVIRDFNEDAVQIVDMSRSNSDVTSEFFTADGTDRAGLRITGMSRELFRRLSLITSREMSEGFVGRLADLGKVLKDMLSGRPYSLGSKEALSAFDDALTFFPHHGKRLRVSTVLRDLEGRFFELSDKVKKMEDERAQRGLSVDSANLLSASLEAGDPGLISQYFELCMDCAEIDSRLINAEETISRVQELRVGLERIGSMEYFPLDFQKQIEELFTRYQSRQTDYQSLLGEYGQKIQEFEFKQKQLMTQYQGLDSFAPADAQAINTLAREYQMVQQDLSEFQVRQKNEIERLKTIGIQLPELDELRRTFQLLTNREGEDALLWESQLETVKNQIAQCEKNFARQRLQLVEIDRERKVVAAKNRLKSVISGLSMILSIGASLAIFFIMHTRPHLLFYASLVVDAATFLSTIFFTVLFMKPKHFKANMFKAAQLNMNRETATIDELNEKRRAFELKFDALAHKVKLVDGADFVDKLRDYKHKIPQLRDLEVMEQTISARDASLSKLKLGVEPYFARAGRQTLEISTETTIQLANEISSYVAQSYKLLADFKPVIAAKEQLEFLNSELKEINNQLQSSFVKAKMEHLHDYKESYREFTAKVAVYQQWQSMRSELHRLENDMSSGFVPDELPPQIERLEKSRLERIKAMQELVNRSPNIVDLAPRTPTILAQSANIQGFSIKNLAAKIKTNIDLLKVERDGLTALVRSANSSDASYMMSLQELRSIQAELTIVRRVKMALEQARDRVVQFQSNSLDEWHQKLTEILEDMVTQMGVELPAYETAFCDSVTDSESARSGPLSGKPFSLLTMEQVRWFARAIVSRVLALNQSFPLVFNEPFGIGQEPLRESNLPFIFTLLEQQFQVLALTSDASRFEAAYSAASTDQKLLIHTCARVALGS